jgi:coenzyme F420-0:L-glutamate ligase/coenzyme F420-1:gamma-L-glutamate ligase
MAAGTAVTISIHPLAGLSEIHPGDDLAGLLAAALARAGLGPEPGDVLVVTHKAVSKAEGAVVPLEGDQEAAYRRLVEEQSMEILRRRGSLVIAKTRHGFICANAGVDRSNTAPGTAVLLPADPDRSAHGLRLALRQLTGTDVPVVITDTFGRAWRKGLVDVAIGVSGLEVILDLRGTRDAQGRELKVTEVAVVDEIAAAADLAMGKAAGTPAALVRGLTAPRGEGRAADLVRPPGEDMFR